MLSLSTHVFRSFLKFEDYEAETPTFVGFTIKHDLCAHHSSKSLKISAKLSYKQGEEKQKDKLYIVSNSNVETKAVTEKLAWYAVEIKRKNGMLNNRGTERVLYEVYEPSLVS